MSLNLEELKNQINILEKAIKTLNEWINFDNWNDVYRDWIIQRFEYCIELTRKTWKKVLEYKWFGNIIFPKDVFKKLNEIWLLKNINIWIDFIDYRNQTSHIYSDDVAIEIYDYIKWNYIEFNNILNVFYDIID
jgi:nucleotidyltransferase substrate binding protein (TIGR01987 family)